MLGNNRKGTSSLKETFAAQMDTLSSMLYWIRQSLHALYIPESLHNSIELACEEALVNIIHYGYPEASGSIALSCKRENNCLTISIVDQGVPYNPLKSIPSVPLPQIGGYGVLIMLHLMDKVDYQYVEGRNELTLIKDL